jgi:hypothetical protein
MVYVGTKCGNSTTKLVSRNHRQTLCRVVAMEDVQIGSANARAADADQGIFWPDLRHGHIFHLKPAGCDEDGSLHRAPYLTLRNLARSIVRAMAAIKTKPKTIYCWVA